MSDLSYLLARSCNLEEPPSDNENEKMKNTRSRGHRRTISCDTPCLLNSKVCNSLPPSEKHIPLLPSYEEQSGSSYDYLIFPESIPYQDRTDFHERCAFYKPKTDYFATPYSPPDSCLCHLSSDCPPFYLDKENAYINIDNEKCYCPEMQLQSSYSSIRGSGNGLPVIDEVASDDNISYISTLP